MDLALSATGSQLIASVLPNVCHLISFLSHALYITE